MDRAFTDAEGNRFDAYVGSLCDVIGHADRERPLHDYCLGLTLPGDRKSVEPMAALTAPARTSQQHQILLHFVANASWSDEAMLAKVREIALPAMERHGPIETWIIDDTGLPKKGKHSVGVARQYCGQLGKQDNCQVVVSLSIANHDASLPLAHRLYLPEAWASDPERRAKAKVPRDIVFQTKPEIALDLLRTACADGVPPGVVLADAAYGNDSGFRTGITALGLSYSVGIQSTTLLWKPDATPPPRKGKRRYSHARIRPYQATAKELALALPPEAWHAVTWRIGAEPLHSRFARLHVSPAGRVEPPPEEWLLIEWPEDEPEPIKYWLSTLPEDTGFEVLVDLTKLRWRIERDYQELKQQFGFGQYEGRGWRGLHHHMTLCVAVYGFLIAERAAIPPSVTRTRPKTFAVSNRDRCQSASRANRATHRTVNSDNAPVSRRSAGETSRTMSVLPPAS